MALLSLDDIKEYLQITGTDDDDLLTLLNELIQGEVEALLDRNLEEATYTDEVLRYNSSHARSDDNYHVLSPTGKRLSTQVKNYPITDTATFEITFDGDTVDSDNYSVDGETGIIWLFNHYSDYKRVFKVTYSAGYTSTTLPKGLKSVMLQGVKSVYKTSAETKKGTDKIQSKKVRNFSVTYASDAMKSYVSSNASILLRYASVAI